LIESSAGLTELRGICNIAAILNKVSSVEQIEYLAEQDEPNTLSAERERAAKPQVLGEGSRARLRPGASPA